MKTTRCLNRRVTVSSRPTAMVPSCIPFASAPIPNYQWYGTDHGDSHPQFKELHDEKEQEEAVPDKAYIGSYEATDAVFAGPREPPTQHNQGVWNFPPLPHGGGILTPPFVYRPDRTATWSNTVYKRVGRAKVHPYSEVREEMRKTPYEHVPEGVPMEKPDKPEKATIRPKTCTQAQMASFAQAHRWEMPRHDGTKNKQYVLPRRRKKAKK